MTIGLLTKLSASSTSSRTLPSWLCQSHVCGSCKCLWGESCWPWASLHSVFCKYIITTTAAFHLSLSLMMPRACLTSILRTYVTWRFVESADKSYWFGWLGLWSTAELAVGIVTGCLPVTPKFVQHVRPILHSAFSTLWSTSTSDAIKTLTSTTLAKIKAPFVSKYGIEPGIASGADPTPPYAPQPHGEYYMLDELATSQDQKDNRAAIPTPSGGGAATRRDDLEYGY